MHVVRVDSLLDSSAPSLSPFSVPAVHLALPTTRGVGLVGKRG